jgi:hypothetical protein
MSETHKIICDTCGKNITASGNSVDWRLAVKNESVPSMGGFVTDMMIYPITNHDTHYCSWRCFVDSSLVDEAISGRAKAKTA